MTRTPSLFDPVEIGELKLSNRIVMAPLTRNRAGPGDVPSVLAVEYYRQRATAGLIVSEGSQISQQGQGYESTPGIYTAAQVEGWKPITRAVHDAGGRIVIQLWHVGRVSHVSLQPGGAAPVAPSAIRAETKTYLKGGFADVSEPRALETGEIAGIVADYATAAKNAIEAGFDGVEIHGANGYLIDQFLCDGTNRRTDAYGGSPENRTRFLAEVLAAVTDTIGAGRTGLRLSPASPANGISDSNRQVTFNAAADVVGRFGLAFVHVVEGATGGARDFIPDFDFAEIRRRAKAPYIANNGYDKALAEAAIAGGRADLVAFGRPFISNPDLVERLRRGAPLAPLNRDTLYGGGAHGYTDYPPLENA